MSRQPDVSRPRSNTPSALLPVGRDCDCGFPLVWFGERQLCAVYGSHPTPSDRVYFRSGVGGYDELIRASMDAPNLASRTVRSAAARRLRRAS